MVVKDLEGGETQTAKLRGRMGSVEVVLSVLAYVSPLTTAWGYLPIVIYFAGLGTPLVFLIAMGVLLLFSVGYVAMSQRVKNPGAFYALISHGINKETGLGAAFLATLGYFLTITGVSTYFGIAVSSLISNLGGPTIPWYVLVVGLLVVVGIFGYIGIEFSAKTLAFLMVIEISIVVIYDIAVLSHGGPDGFTLAPFSVQSLMSGNPGLGVMFAIMMFIGFEGTAVYREEAKDPAKTIPRATYGSVIFIGVFYSITSWLLMVAWGPEAAVEQSATDPAGMFPTTLENMLGTIARDVASVFVITAVFAATLSTHNIFTRYLYSLGVDHALPAKLGRVHKKQGSPYVASVTASIVCLIALGIVVVTQVDPNIFYGRVGGVAVLCIMIVMLITSVAVLVYFARLKGDDRPSLWKRAIAPLLATLGLGAIVYLTIANANDMMASPTTLSILFITLILLVFVAGTITAKYMKSKRPETYARLGREGD